MRKVVFVSLLIAAICTMGVAESELVITGSTTVLPIAQACAEEYMNAHEDAFITVRGGGSGVGIAALIDDQCDIADASREIKEKEIEAAKADGVEPVDHVVALDAIAVVVNPALEGVEELGIEQIASIFTGEVKSWEAFGGPDEEIVIISRDVSSGTFEVFKEMVLSGEPVDDGALKLASNQAVATTVASTPGAIGYIGFGYLSKKLKALKIEGVEPSIKTAREEEYPIVRSLHMYTDGQPTGLAGEFLDFVLGKQGQALVEEMGYVPVR